MNFLKSSQVKVYILLILLTIVAGVPFFYKIDKLGLQEWDEFFYAENAIEMARNNNFITKYTDGKPDLYNTKPPLITWVQVVFLKIFGENIYSIRIPIGISGLLLVYLVFWFFYREFKNLIAPVLFALLFCTSGAILAIHVGRTGDHDLPLSLFLTGALLCFYLYLNYKNIKYLYATTLLLVFSFLTKSVFTFLIFPGMILSVIYFKQVKELFANKHFYYNILLFIGLNAAYFITRELDSPGYFNAVWELDVMRYSNTVDLHKHEFSFYIINLFTGEEGLGIWKYLLPISLISLFFLPAAYKRFSTYIAFHAFLFLLIISKSETKLVWYQTLFVVLIYIHIAIFIFQVLEGILGSMNFKKTYHRPALTFLFLLTIFAPVYSAALQHIDDKKEADHLNFWPFIRKLDKEDKVKQRIQIYTYPWSRHLKFYQKAYKKASIEIPFFESIKSGDTIMMCEKVFLDKIGAAYSYEVLDEYENCKRVRLIENISAKLPDISGEKTFNYKNLLFSHEQEMEFDAYSESKIVAKATKRQKNQVICYGPYIHLEPGNYVAKYRLKTANSNLYSPVAVVAIESANYPNNTLAYSFISGAEFLRSNEYNEFYLNFRLDKPLDKVEFLVRDMSDYDLVLDYIQIKKIDSSEKAPGYNFNNKLLPASNGRVVFDSTSRSKLVISSRTLQKDFVSYGGFIEAEPGKYKVALHVKTTLIQGEKFNNTPFKLDIFSLSKNRVLYESPINSSGKFDEYSLYMVEFTLSEKVNDLEIRTILNDNCRIAVDYVTFEKIIR